MECELTGELFFWRGPAPWFFVTVPAEHCRELKETASEVSYGWGMIPAIVAIGATEWTTALFPKNGRYLIPVKASVRDAECIADGDIVTVRLRVGP